jgi:magnesium-transporting ATPase (P-type)
MMTVIVQKVGNGLKPFRTMLFSKGAPESILAVCDKIQIGKKIF